MPNWTEIELRCHGIGDLPIFSINEMTGEKELDFNKVVPMPEYVRNTVAPTQIYAILHYLFTEFSEQDARDTFERLRHGANPLSLTAYDEELLSHTASFIIESTNMPLHITGCETVEISAYDLGKNYVTAYENTGCFNWYDWSTKNWGAKWNADTLGMTSNKVWFQSPWGYPHEYFQALAKAFPDKEFTAYIVYEDEPSITYIIEFSADRWFEFEEYTRSIEQEKYEIKLGFYPCLDGTFNIALGQYYLDDFDHVITLNLEGSVVPIKNAAYVDTLNYPDSVNLISEYAVDTGLRKRVGTFEYPLYRFDEKWLKSLKCGSTSYEEYEAAFYDK